MPGYTTATRSSWSNATPLKNGDIVVALVEDSATVKRLLENGHCLQPENDMQPIIVDQVEGKVIGLLRSF